MSKSSRRASRTGNRPAGASRSTEPAATDQTGTEPRSAVADTTRPSARPARPAGTRAGRRERSRPLAERSFFERYRTPIIAVVAIAVVAVLGAFAFTSGTRAAYSCSTEFTPGTTPAPEPGTTNEPGFVQPSMGNSHAPIGTEVTYTYCPPATGSHYNVEGRGPIRPNIYGPNDAVIPQGWVHNLEHGALVVLYRGRDGDPGPTPEVQAEMEAWAAQMPPSPVCGYSADDYLIVARFDQMATPFAALVWGRILPLGEWDPEAIENFWNTNGEQELTMPERIGGCPLPDEVQPSPSPS